ALDSPELDAFVAEAGRLLSGTQPLTMLTPGIHASFDKGVEALATHDAVRTIARGCPSAGPNQAVGALFETDASHFLADRALGHEVFGSSSII
ncbi:aldehyde dehydrogenase (NADP(+)), partial [Pseudomonas sp. MPR-R2A5]